MLQTAAAPRRVSHPPSERPLLVFDGTCPFCRRWVGRWRAAAGDRFDIEPAEFARAVQFIETDGRISSAAEAVLRARAHATSRSWLLAAYERLPGFASAAEAAYRVVARHRPLLSRLTRRF